MAGVVWITGLSGVGKTTTAELVRQRLVRAGRPPVLLDGDRVRHALAAGPGFEPAERRRLAMVYARPAAEIASQGHLVVCATVSLFHAVHEWNREHLPGYLEVWLRESPEALRGRSEVYRRTGVVGVDIAAEFPRSLHLAVDTTTTRPDDVADRVLALVERTGT
ncbi:adenylyl-sulfate kinase [Actinosynnema sp. NPDC002837]